MFCIIELSWKSIDLNRENEFQRDWLTDWLAGGLVYAIERESI